MNLTSFIRVCGNCSSYGFYIDLYCENCWTKIRKEYKNSLKVYGYEFPVSSLFSWKNKNNNTISSLLYDLKGKNYPDVCKKFVLDFLVRLENQSNQNFDFICYPSSFRKINHAYLLAKEFSELLNIKYLVEIYIDEVSSSNTKNLLKSERFLRKFYISKENKKILKRDKKNFKSCLFIDDVITTGSTAIGARKTLVNCPRFESWTLAHRPLLRTLSKKVIIKEEN